MIVSRVKGRKKKRRIHILHNDIFTFVSQADEFMNDDNQYPLTTCQAYDT